MTGADRYPTLFSPVRLGPIELRHRIAMSGMSVQLADTVVNDRLVAFIGERARGGAALITLGSAPVHPSVHTYEQKQLALYSDEVVPGLARLADEVHAHGAKLSQILWHGGHNVPVRSGWASVAPSPIPSVVHGNVPRAITKRELRDLLGYYARAAKRCRDAGLDAVEVQTAADYILGSFLSPTLNRRTDEYGGSAENRARYVCEVLEAVREAVDDRCAVAIRTSSAHLIATDPDGYGVEDSLEIMQLLTGRGLVDWIGVLPGSYWSAPQIISPMHYPRVQWADHTKAYRDAGLGVPILANGRIRTPAEAERLLVDGAADVIVLGRPFIADPDWPAKVERGDEERIRPCISCNQGCWGSFVVGAPVTCIVNPAAGNELTLPRLEPATTPRRIAVIGGGPAGLEAARVAAERGHRVTLYEARDRLGGDLRLAADAPHRGEVGLALVWWERELEQLGVDVRLGERVSGAPPDADETIWCTGATPAQTQVWRYRPALADGIPGTAGLPHGREVMRGDRTVSGNVLVIDEESGWAAASLAEWLAAQPGVTAVTVATTAEGLGLPELHHTLEIFDVAPRAAAAGVTVLPQTFVESVDGSSATVLGRDEPLGPFDAVVLSTGTAASELPEDALAAGDCVAARGNIWAATIEAGRVARAV